MHPDAALHSHYYTQFLHSLHQMMSVDERIHIKTHHSNVITEDNGRIVYGVNCWYWLYVNWNSPQSQYKQQCLKATFIKVVSPCGISLGYLVHVLHMQHHQATGLHKDICVSCRSLPVRETIHNDRTLWNSGLMKMLCASLRQSLSML
jgi:hypothetical protein